MTLSEKTDLKRISQGKVLVTGLQEKGISESLMTEASEKTALTKTAPKALKETIVVTSEMTEEILVARKDFARSLTGMSQEALKEKLTLQKDVIRATDQADPSCTVKNALLAEVILPVEGLKEISETGQMIEGLVQKDDLLIEIANRQQIARVAPRVNLISHGQEKKADLKVPEADLSGKGHQNLDLINQEVVLANVQADLKTSHPEQNRLR